MVSAVNVKTEKTKHKKKKRHKFRFLLDKYGKGDDEVIAILIQH